MKKNPFKELVSHKEPPSTLKKKVVGEIAGISLATDIAALFSVKLANVLGSLFKPSKEEVNKKRKREKE